MKTQFTVIRFEAKHDGDRTNVNIPGYDVNNVTKSRSPTKFFILIVHIFNILILFRI